MIKGEEYVRFYNLVLAIAAVEDGGGWYTIWDAIDEAKINLRIATERGGYPGSEAQYSSIEEFEKTNPSYVVDKEFLKCLFRSPRVGYEIRGKRGFVKGGGLVVT